MSLQNVNTLIFLQKALDEVQHRRDIYIYYEGYLLLKPGAKHYVPRVATLCSLNTEQSNPQCWVFRCQMHHPIRSAYSVGVQRYYCQSAKGTNQSNTELFY